MKLAEIRKLLVAAGGVIAAAITSGLLHGQAETYAEIAIAVLGLFGIYVTQNGQSDYERRIADLEQSHPGLEAVAELVKTGVVAGLQQSKASSSRAASGRFAKPEAAPEPVAPAEPGPVADEDYPASA